MPAVPWCSAVHGLVNSDLREKSLTRLKQSGFYLFIIIINIFLKKKKNGTELSQYNNQPKPKHLGHFSVGCTVLISVDICNVVAVVIIEEVIKNLVPPMITG